MSSSIIKARHAFTTRYGGVSRGNLSSLNLGATRGDEPEAVRENYRRVAALMGAGPDDCVVTNQVHGNVVKIAGPEDRHVCMGDVPYRADGLVTNVPGLPLMCFVADCVPALLCDAENGVIAAVHCGWKGSVADILGEAVKKMRSLGAETEHICAAMGAAIGRCCFETDDDVPEAVAKYLGGDTGGLFDRRSDGKTMVDLKAANARRLIQLGLKPENIDVSEECTMCSHEKYWSHRYTQRYTNSQRGNQAAVIVLDGEKH
ncbi:MAG: peptidoglycan editing factor PgeF [Candidatus Limivicinus sp.]